MNKKYLIFGFLILVIFSVVFLYYKNQSNKSGDITNVHTSDLESQLLNTSWLQLDENENETDFEIDFKSTKDNDPLHKYYDYFDYLYQKPRQSGSWKLDGSKIVITNGSKENISAIVYRNVKINYNIMTVKDDDVEIKFKRIHAQQ